MAQTELYVDVSFWSPCFRDLMGYYTNTKNNSGNVIVATGKLSFPIKKKIKETTDGTD